MTMEKKTDSTINGVGCTVLVEPVPNYNIAACEKVIEGQNNTYIVLGRDRPGDIFTGYGGRGTKNAGSIDIVAGRTSAIVQEKNKDGEKLLTNPSTAFDAARILVSQKSDPDSNFFLPDGVIGNRKAVSTVLAKADDIRLIAREGGKLVANADRYDSNGQLKIRRFGWDIIATDGKKIQPIPKGKNLVDCLENIYENLGHTGSEIANLYRIIVHLTTMLGAHTHPTAMGPSGPSLELLPVVAQIGSEAGLHIGEQQMNQALLEKAKFDFLKILGEKYINSLYHNVD
jgi:hypothetical protein